MDALISIIIPVYNVEKYLGYCIDSVLKQTYHNIQVILVDDGSTDTCSNICDAYKLKDNRVEVIHKKNGGLSDARNTGLKSIKGDYICFVDSDDRISPVMIEKLYKALIDNNSDISICGIEDIFIDVPKEESLFDGYFQRITVLSGELATEYILEDKKILAYVCNKMFRSELFKGIEFPIGKRFEDMYITHELTHLAKNVVVIPDKLYIYYHHSQSISSTNTLQNYNDICGAYLKRLDFTIKFCPSMYKEVLKQTTIGCINFYNLILKEPKSSINFDSSYVKSFLKKNRKDIIQSGLIPIKYKIYCLCISYLTLVYNISFSFLHRIMNNLSSFII